MQKGGEGLDRILRIWIESAIEIVVNFIAIPIILAQFDKTVALMMIGFVLVYYGISRISKNSCGLISMQK